MPILEKFVEKIVTLKQNIYDLFERTLKTLLTYICRYEIRKKLFV